MTTEIWTPSSDIWLPELDWDRVIDNVKARKDKFVAAMVFGSTGPALETTVTAARWLSDTQQTGPPTDTNTYFYYCRGYANDSDFLNGSGLSEGSMGANTYEDGGSTTRTIEHIGYYEVEQDLGGDFAIEDDLCLGLNGTSISNTDTTFKSIEVELSTGGNQEYLRSAATYEASQNGMTTWRWQNITHNNHFLVANNTHDFIVNL